MRKPTSMSLVTLRGMFPLPTPMAGSGPPGAESGAVRRVRMASYLGADRRHTLDGEGRSVRATLLGRTLVEAPFMARFPAGMPKRGFDVIIWGSKTKREGRGFIFKVRDGDAT
jgi:hypothetical protein